MATRRRFIQWWLTATLSIAAVGCASNPSGDSTASRPETPGDALQALKDGNERFVGSTPMSRDHLARVAETAGGQAPFAIILSCLDSRVPPEMVFDQGVGDVFVGRIAGNFANTDMIGSFEFGTKLAGSKLIVVLGHSECGAVKGACDGAELGNLTHTLGNIIPAVEAVEGNGDRSSGNAAFVQRVADANVRLTVEALTSRSPVMSQLVEEGKLEIIGAMYDVGTGRVTFMD